MTSASNTATPALPELPAPHQAGDGELEAAADLIGAVIKAETNGEALGLIVRYRLKTIELDRARCAAAIAADRAANSLAAPGGKYDEVLLPFFRFMESELHANCGKGDRPGWLTMTREQGLLEIYYHVSKLQKAVRDNDAARIRENTADVANMAMMLLDVCGGINSDGCWYCGSKPGEGCQKPFDDVPCRRAPSVGAGAAELPGTVGDQHFAALALVERLEGAFKQWGGWSGCPSTLLELRHAIGGLAQSLHLRDATIADYESRLTAPLAAVAVDAEDRASIPAEPRALAHAIRGLQALRTVLGIDSPETRGWAPAVQQESRRAIDRALALLKVTS